MKEGINKPDTLTVRLESGVKERMEIVRNAMPYKPSITAIVDRGIELALAELEFMTGVSADYLIKMRETGMRDKAPALQPKEGE
jgi:hypothetical protein